MRGPHGCLGGLTRSEQRRLVAEYIAESDGKLLHAAHFLGYSRRNLYYVIERLHLWPFVNKVREQRLHREALEKKHGVSQK